MLGPPVPREYSKARPIAVDVVETHDRQRSARRTLARGPPTLSRFLGGARRSKDHPSRRDRATAGGSGRGTKERRNGRARVRACQESRDGGEGAVSRDRRSKAASASVSSVPARSASSTGWPCSCAVSGETRQQSLGPALLRLGRCSCIQRPNVALRSRRKDSSSATWFTPSTRMPNA